MNLEWFTLKHIVGVIVCWFFLTPIIGFFINDDEFSGFLGDFKVGVIIEITLIVIFSTISLIIWLLN